MIVRRVAVHGRVQGVFYRGWAIEAARGLGLRGWVRNRRDGTVEMVVAGDEEAVLRMIDICREGPAAARVSRVEVEVADEAVPAGFDQRP